MTDTGIDRARLREACARHLRESRETSNIGLEDAAELACMAPDELAACEAGSEDIGVVEYVTLMLEYGADPMAPYRAVGVA